MFHDFAARDVSCPKKHIGVENTERQKKEKKKKSPGAPIARHKLCLPKWWDGQMEVGGQGQVKETLCERGEVYLINKGGKKWRKTQDVVRGLLTAMWQHTTGSLSPLTTQ